MDRQKEEMKKYYEEHIQPMTEMETKDFTAEEAKMLVNYYINLVAYTVLIWVILVIIMIQGVYLCILNKIKYSQECLEHYYMDAPSQQQYPQVPQIVVYPAADAPSLTGNQGVRNYMQ